MDIVLLFDTRREEKTRRRYTDPVPPTRALSIAMCVPTIERVPLFVTEMGETAHSTLRAKSPTLVVSECRDVSAMVSVLLSAAVEVDE